MKKIRKKLNSILSVSEQKKLSVNFANFGLFQIISYLVPVITIPYIVRVIGPEKFGILSIAQAFTYYLWIITDYGYSISGVQLISQNQNNIPAGSRILKNIISIQLLINAGCLLITVLVFNLYKPFAAYRYIFLFYFFSSTATIFLSPWLYTGLEKVKYISTLTLIHRSVYVILIFTMLHNESDYYLVPVFYSGSMLLGGGISLILILVKFKFSFNHRVPLALRHFLKQDQQIYISNIFANLYRNSNILILSLFVSEASVGIYAAAEKIIKAIQGVFNPITQAFYPYISRITKISHVQSIRVIKYTLAFVSLLAGGVALAIFIFADSITHLAFGSGFASTAAIMRIASPVILFGVTNFVVGIIFMTNYGMKRQFSYSVISVGLLNLAVCSLLSYLIGALGAGISFLSAEFILLLFMSFFIYNNQELWKGNDVRG